MIGKARSLISTIPHSDGCPRNFVGVLTRRPPPGIFDESYRRGRPTTLLGGPLCLLREPNAGDPLQVGECPAHRM